MPYSEMLIAPMRGELTALGAKELKTAERGRRAVEDVRARRCWS